tara:strand:+ start:1066 stop:2376 length:1311 start_codon:yes stop_codon:yes gene_type:complete
MAINFPDSPSNGDTHTANGVVYTYNSTSTLWDTIGGGSGGSSVTVSDTAPTSPSDGDQWFDSTDGSLSVYYNDGSSSQWISTSGPAGAAGVDGTNGTDGTDGTDGSSGSSVTSYANLAAFPSSGNTVGDFGFATDTKAVYIWDGVEWDRINSGGDETPRLTTTPSSIHNLNMDGTTTSITIAAEDPEGFPITYSHDTSPSSPNQVTSITNSGGVFTLTPSTTTTHEGTFTLRLKANDGVHITSHAIAVSLVFQTAFTFDTSLSMINTNYTTTNKLEATVSTSVAAAPAQQIGKMGKGYLEYKLISYGNYPMIGLGSGDSSLSYGYNSGNAVYIYKNGNKYENNVSTGLGTIVTNDIFMFAYDTATEEVWFGRNGTWASGRDPTAGESGFSCNGAPATHGFRPMLTNGSSTAGTTQLEIISHTQGAQYTIPSGWVLA